MSDAGPSVPSARTDEPAPTGVPAPPRATEASWRRLAPGLVILTLGAALAAVALLSAAPVPSFPALVDEPLGQDGQVVFAQDGCIRIASLDDGAVRELACPSGVDALAVSGDRVRVTDYGSGSDLSVDLETGYVTTLPPGEVGAATPGASAADLRVTTLDDELTVQRVDRGAVETVLRVAVPSSYSVYDVAALDGAVAALDSSDRVLVFTDDGRSRVVATAVDALARVEA